MTATSDIREGIVTLQAIHQELIRRAKLLGVVHADLISMDHLFCLLKNPLPIVCTVRGSAELIVQPQHLTVCANGSLHRTNVGRMGNLDPENIRHWVLCVNNDSYVFYCTAQEIRIIFVKVRRRNPTLMDGTPIPSNYITSMNGEVVT